MSFAERQIGMLSRSKFFRLTIINNSEPTRRTDWIRLSPGRYGQPCTNCMPLFLLVSSARHGSPTLSIFGVFSA
eukprot:3084659-Pyramimonas_sp.AAC.1